MAFSSDLIIAALKHTRDSFRVWKQDWLFFQTKKSQLKDNVNYLSIFVTPDSSSKPAKLFGATPPNKSALKSAKEERGHLVLKLHSTSTLSLVMISLDLSQANGLNKHSGNKMTED